MMRAFFRLLCVVIAAAACNSQDKASGRSTEIDTAAIEQRKAAGLGVEDSVSVNDSVRGEPVVFGYLFGARFYPLLRLDARGFDGERALADRDAGTLTNPSYVMHLVLAGREARAFANPAHVTQLLAETAYVDPYNNDRPGKFGAVTPLPDGVVVFAYLGRVLEAFEFRADTAISRDFYRSFSRDRWGRHFFDNVSLDAPFQIVADSSNIVVHGMTDFDGDRAPELWLTYQLMYGEIGAMVWERTPRGWRMIAYHCFRCD